MKDKLFIGIDPGVKEKNGFAVWSKIKREFIYIYSHSTVKTLNLLMQYSQNFDITVFLEAPQLNKPVFIKHFNNKMNINEKLKIAQNIGINKDRSMIIKEFCDYYGIECNLCKPGKNSMTKFKKDIFQNITGYKSRTNSHSRDAAMLVFGM